MKHLLVLLLCAVSISCAKAERTSLQAVNGRDGVNGANGVNGTNGTNGGGVLLPGVSCNLHDLASWSGTPSLPLILANNPPVGSFVLPNFNVGDSPSANGFPGMPASLQAIVGLEGYALDCNGYLYVPTSGVYTFKLLSDDGVYLSVEDVMIVEHQGIHPPTLDTGYVSLLRGYNRINVIYFQGPKVQIALQLKWSGPNTAEQVVPAVNLSHWLQ